MVILGLLWYYLEQYVILLILYGFCFQDCLIFQIVTLPKQNYGTIWISFQDHLISRTVSNCHQNREQKPTAAADALPRSDDVEMAGGDGAGGPSGEAGDEDTNQGVVDECTITPILQDDGQPVCEVVDTPKLKKKGTKCAQE